MTNYWLSWWHTQDLSAFELNWPWWVSGYRDGGDEQDDAAICAAVQADDEDAAKGIVIAAYDVRPDDVEWRFVSERPADWSPFCDRFPKADWMAFPALAAPRGGKEG